MYLPSNTLTFLFTDIEGSTALWEAQPSAMRVALEEHDTLLRATFSQGHVFKTVGDAFCVAFTTAPEAVRAALEAQQALRRFLEEPIPIRVRMAIHTGAVETRDSDYFGPTLNRLARLLATAAGGQVLLSQASYELIWDALPPQASTQPLGEHRLKDLARPETVYQLCHPELPSDFPPLRSLDNALLPNNLPQQMTNFIGRERDVAEVKVMLEKTRLLTITGSGGCGKTRLSLQVAADCLENYQDGVWLVELAPLSQPSQVAPFVAEVLGIQEIPGEPLAKTFASHLRNKHLLLVLDNCEHLLGATATLVDTLLRGTTKVKLLASSREGLGIAGEQAYRIASLSLPDLNVSHTPASLVQYESVQLFVERARAVQPDFRITPESASALVSLCHRLDGIPLAIELAAARVRSLTLTELTRRLDDRFRLLTGGSRTALPRQQTLRALIDWSYSLLNAAEKALLARLSVFSGGWTLEATESVCVGDPVEEWEILDLLTSLVDKSLVLAENQSEQTRFRLLETVRQYGREKLADDLSALQFRRQHRDYFLEYARQREQLFYSRGEPQAYEDLDRELDNLLDAFYWTMEEAGDGAAMRKAEFLCCLGHYAFHNNLFQVAYWDPHVWEHIQALLRTLVSYNLLGLIGWMHLLNGAPAQAIPYAEEAVQGLRSLGEKRILSVMLYQLGLLHLGRSIGSMHSDEETLTAFIYLEEVLSIGQLDNPFHALSFSQITSINSNRENYQESYQKQLQALEQTSEMRHYYRLNIFLHLHRLSFLLDRRVEALLWLRKSLQITLTQIIPISILKLLLDNVLNLLMNHPSQKSLAILLGARARIEETSSTTIDWFLLRNPDCHQAMEEWKTAMLQTKEFREAFEEGYQRSTSEALQFALDLVRATDAQGFS